MLRPTVAVPSPIRRDPEPEKNEPGSRLNGSAVREPASAGVASGIASAASAASAASGRLPASDPPGAGEPTDPVVPLIPASREGTLFWRLRGMIRTMRPHQWVKNLFVLAPVVFARELTRPSFIMAALGAFAVFCLLAGAVYTLNDLVDADADRVHPVKRYRPIASGRVPVPLARAMVIVLVTLALGSALVAGILYDRLPFFFVALAYFLQNVAYSFRLKKVAYVDVGFIALGFVLRVLAGGYATHTPVSGYMIACTALLALFLGFGKRRHELSGANAAKQRSALEAYTPRALTIALAVTGFASVADYLAYTLDPPPFFNPVPWLWLTTLHPLFGVIRFLELVVGRPKAESPTQEMLRDVPFVLNLVLWVIEILAIIYHVRFE
jgi:decaprenyl-phosphate phosphoribosyltransferase